jgi:hypothetical protein
MLVLLVAIGVFIVSGCAALVASGQHDGPRYLALAASSLVEVLGLSLLSRCCLAP